MMPQETFWRGRRVLLTGHTGFKGAWLAIWLHRLGALVEGYALDPPSRPNLFELSGLSERMVCHHADVADAAELSRIFAACRPEVVFHLAAQPLVGAGYRDPVETFRTNVLGTVTVLEAARQAKTVGALINVTTDKCYRVDGHPRGSGFSETDPLGGHDPYAGSKVCSELVSETFRRAFGPAFSGERMPPLATARAGNVIGGGDWGAERLLPDVVRALQQGVAVKLRRPAAIRPWQHVLEPLCGYLLLAEQLWRQPEQFQQAWNFGPADEATLSVQGLVERFIAEWGGGVWEAAGGNFPHETATLRLDSTLARQRLAWAPRLRIDAAVAWTAAWYRRLAAGDDAWSLCAEQIADYESGPAS